MSMFEGFICRLVDGIEIGEFKAHARNIRQCGPKGALSMEIYLKIGSEEEHLLCVAVFPGRKPHYKPWMEFFCISNCLKLSGTEYFDSTIEDALLEAFSRALGPGGKVYVEYYCDRETSYGLAMGFPPPITRQGYKKLFNLGFTWFKDWYFSEGGHEGGQKLQGEKPMNQAAKDRHLKQIEGQVLAFLERSLTIEEEGEELKYLLRAMERAKELISRIAI